MLRWMELPAGGGSSKLVLVLGWCCCLLALLCFALLCLLGGRGLARGGCVCRLGWLGWAGPSKT